MSAIYSKYGGKGRNQREIGEGKIKLNNENNKKENADKLAVYSSYYNLAPRYLTRRCLPEVTDLKFEKFSKVELVRDG
jgi:hypothetical protein